MKTTIVSVAALIAAFATPALAAQRTSYQGAYHPRAERPVMFEGRSSAIVSTPDLPTSRESMIHAN